MSVLTYGGPRTELGNGIADLAVPLLAHISIFEGLDDDELRLMERRCRLRRYRANQKILDCECISTDVYFIIEGEVRVMAYSPSGREIEFAVVKTGDFFGDLAAIDGLPRSATVTAATSSLLASVNAADFVAILERHSAVTLHVLNRFAHIVRSCDNRIMDLATMSAYQRVYSELLRMAVPDAAVPDQWVIRPYPTEREIASRVGASRETVARAVRQLRDAGWTLRKGRNFYILDRERIESLVASYRCIAKG